MTFSSCNPATGVGFYSRPAWTPAQLDASIAALRAVQPAWRRLPVAERGHALRALSFVGLALAASHEPQQIVRCGFGARGGGERNRAGKLPSLARGTAADGWAPGRLASVDRGGGGAGCRGGSRRICLRGQARIDTSIGR